MANHNNNPFMDAFKMFTENNMFGANKAMPMFDMNNMISMQRKTAEAVSAANQAMAESMNEIMRRQAKIMQANAADMFQLVKEIAISPNPETGMAKQAAFINDSVRSAMDNTREIAEMAVKSNMEVFDMISKRVAENIAECSNVCQHQKKKAA